MAETIDSLTDQQAAHAVKLFYDLSPAELWEEGEKPSQERVKTIAAALVNEAPAEFNSTLAGLAADDEPNLAAARGQVSRLILNRLAESPAFKPIIDRAVQTARQPHMAIDPVTGAFIIALLLATSRKVGGGEVIVDAIRALRLPALLHELPAVLKALPEGVIDALARHLKGA